MISWEFIWFVIIYPLRRLYFDGPDVHGYGCWGGKSSPDICSQITGVDATFWVQNSDDCQIVLERKFVAFYIGTMTIFILIFIYSTINFLSTWLWYHLCFIRPMREGFERVCTASSSITIRDELDDELDKSEPEPVEPESNEPETEN